MVVTQAVNDFIGVSAHTRMLVAEIERAAGSDAKVLITGESGVGKEIAARLIHRLSRRANQTLVTINCAGLPDSLLESELFGHTRGSFTDAYRDRVGRFEIAHGGTIFLDEMGEMSLRMQALLLRFLETGEIQRVGAASPVSSHVDVRVIAATNRNLPARIASGDLREDLFYRLNVFNIDIPPLRSRREDIPVLLQHFFVLYAKVHRLETPAVSPEALLRLMEYDWPGNVRELRNVVERLTVARRLGLISPADLPPEIRDTARPEPESASPAVSTAQVLLDQMLEGHETFWSAVHTPFMARDLTRDDLREVVAKGLRSAGNYKALAERFNLPPNEYKRFLNFLRTHGCDVRFQPVRAVRSRYSTRDSESRLAEAADRGRGTRS